MSYFFFLKGLQLTGTLMFYSSCCVYLVEPQLVQAGSPGNLFLVPGWAFRTARYYQLFKRAHCRLFYQEVDISHDQMGRDFSEKQFVASVKGMLKILSHWVILRKTYKGCRV